MKDNRINRYIEKLEKYLNRKVIDYNISYDDGDSIEIDVKAKGYGDVIEGDFIIENEGRKIKEESIVVLTPFKCLVHEGNGKYIQFDAELPFEDGTKFILRKDESGSLIVPI